MHCSLPGKTKNWKLWEKQNYIRKEKYLPGTTAPTTAAAAAAAAQATLSGFRNWLDWRAPAEDLSILFNLFKKKKSLKKMKICK